MSKVFVVNKGHHNYEQAKEFGELVFLTEESLNIFASSNLVYTISAPLLEQSSGDDYLLLSGHILPNAIAFNTMMKKNLKVKSLVWLGNAGVYKTVTVYND